jgi:hypothetical protein
LRDRDETIRIHVITALVKIYERHSDILSITRLYQCARVQVNDDLANLLVVLETRARPVTDPLLPLPKQAQALQHFMKYWYILAVVATDVLVNLVAGIFVNEYIESKVAWVVGGIAIFLIAVIVYIVQVNHDQRQQAAADANEIALLAEDF